MKSAYALLAVALLALLPAAAFADDALFADGFKYSDEVTVQGIKNGQLDALIKGNDRTFDLDKVDWIELNNQTNFNKAEHSRKDAKAAAALYKTAISGINDPKLKLLAKLRAVAPADADGRFTEAVTYFLDVYAAQPNEAIWKLHPATIPAAGSTMLKESAAAIDGKLASFTSAEAKKNLKTFQLEILTKANDPRAAALAKELGGGGSPESPKPLANANGGNNTNNATATPAEASAPVAPGPGLQGVSDAVRTKNFDGAISQADSMLKSATGDTAVRLFELKAQALEGQNKLDEASACYLRVVAHYPANPNAISDMMRAADLQKAMKHDDEAKRLTDEVAAMRKAPKN